MVTVFCRDLARVAHCRVSVSMGTSLESVAFKMSTSSVLLFLQGSAVNTEKTISFFFLFCSSLESHGSSFEMVQKSINPLSGEQKVALLT